MRKSQIIALIIYFIAFVLPVLGMMNCSGLDESSMAIESCLIDGYIFRAYAGLAYGFLLLSAFSLLIPIAIYVGVVILITKTISKRIDLSQNIVIEKKSKRHLVLKDFVILTVGIYLTNVFIGFIIKHLGESTPLIAISMALYIFGLFCFFMTIYLLIKKVINKVRKTI